MAAEKIEHMNPDILNDIGTVTTALIDIGHNEPPYGSPDIIVDLVALEPEKHYREF